MMIRSGPLTPSFGSRGRVHCVIGLRPARPPGMPCTGAMCARGPRTATCLASHNPVDVAWMQEALLEAQTAFEEGEVPVGAVLVHNGAIVSRARNASRALRDPTAHAEVECLRAAGPLLDGNFAGAWLYVTHEPCPMCAGAILQARLDRVVYGARQPRLGADGSWIDLLRRGQAEAERPIPSPSPSPSPDSMYDARVGVGRDREEEEEAGEPAGPGPGSGNRAATRAPQARPRREGYSDGRAGAATSSTILQQRPGVGDKQGIQHPFHTTLEVTEGVLSGDCERIIQDFFRRRREQNSAEAARQRAREAELLRALVARLRAGSGCGEDARGSEDPGGRGEEGSGESGDGRSPAQPETSSVAPNGNGAALDAAWEAEVSLYAAELRARYRAGRLAPELFRMLDGVADWRWSGS